MSHSSFAQMLSLFLALSATTLAVPKPQWSGGQGNGPWMNMVTVVVGPDGTTTLPPASVIASPPPATTPSGSAATTTQGAAPTSPPPATGTQGTSAPAPSASSSGGSTDSSGRRGIAYNSSSPDLDIFNSYGKIGWGVDWDSKRAQLPGQYMFVPQLWSDASEHTNSWVSDVQAANPSFILSFNEPDIPGQANLQVSQAVSSHIQWMNPQANGGNVKVGSVSVSNGVAGDGAPPMGLDYLGNFLSQCAEATPSCVVDFASVHWYGCTNGCGVDADFAAFTDQMGKAITTANGLDVWITEFQHFGTEQEQQTFISQALTWLDLPAQSKIAKYAYFMVLDGILTSGGSLNSAGTAYAS